MSSVRIVGGVLPGELPERVRTQDLPGMKPVDYHLPAGESVRAAASRAWAYLLPTYRRFREELTKLPADATGTALTRDGWIAPLLKELGYGYVPVTPGGHLDAGEGDERREYPISHLWADIPMHLLGWNLELDSRAKGVAGAARAPQSMVQEYLNRAPEHLWSVMSNGRVLRLLRDSTALVGQTYVEFDLESIFDGEVFSDFVLLFAMCHESRLALLPGAEDNEPVVTDRWIERWRAEAIASGTRALTSLRGQVEKALEVLGSGYLAHPANQELRDRLASGELTVAEYQRSLLRLVYRLLFWMVAEDRGALLDPKADSSAAKRYEQYFSSRRLRNLARRRVGTRHRDLSAQVDLVSAGLGTPGGLPELGLPGLGGIFERSEIDVVVGQALGNQSLLEAIRLLSTTRDPNGHILRSVDFRHLGAEELGGIYEGLLELHPRVDPAERTFTLASGAGNERKTSGSYYTPSSLIDLVLDTSLDPLLDRATSTGTSEEQQAALLALRVCDPACGSGHFLVAAARRIANRLARLRSGETEPTEVDAQQSLHDVVGQCIYGIDVNPMAAELAKVSLWLEAIQPGRPLGFLDARIKIGNSLLGTTPTLIAGGIPDSAFTAITGDDKKTATSMRKFNAQTRDAAGQGSLLDSAEMALSNIALMEATREITAAPALTLDDIVLQRQRYERLRESPELRRAKSTADAWTAAFFQEKRPNNPAPITTDTVRMLETNGNPPGALLKVVDDIAALNRFFHWHVEFPDVFVVPDEGDFVTDPVTGWVGGFDAIVGNPPWERFKIQEKEFFAERDPEIANAPNAAARRRMIKDLLESNPVLANDFDAAKRSSESKTRFVQKSGRYPLTGHGDVNSYAVFAETFRTVVSPGGRAGIIAPTGLAMDMTTAPFFRELVVHDELAGIYDFRNTGFFEGVAQSQGVRFAVFAIQGSATAGEQRPILVFRARSVEEALAPARQLRIDAADFLRLNPNTGTCPQFLSLEDAQITLGIYRRHPTLIRDGEQEGNPWGLSFMRMFDMANDSEKFRTAEDLDSLGAVFDGWVWTLRNADGSTLTWWPLYEGKMLSHYNHRHGSYLKAVRAPGKEVRALPDPTPGELDDPTYEPFGRYWVAERDVREALEGTESRGWLFGWRNSATSLDVRTMIPSVLPRTAVGHAFPIGFAKGAKTTAHLQAIWSSLVFDYVVRQKLSGSNVTYSAVKQIAIPTPERFSEPLLGLGVSLGSFVEPRVLEVAYTSNKMAPYAQDLGNAGEPFRWDPERRALITAELDAAMMHVYGLARNEVEHILDSFTVLRKYEERDYDEFRTRRLVLDFYDRMTTATETGIPYETPISPPPGEGPRHPPRSFSE